jgi:Flp pilus assembly protein TadD
MLTMTEAHITLDQEEILALALNALRTGDHGAALTHLKQGAERFPDNARIAYLLGAEHAQIGLYDRAEEEMARAIALAPSLLVARFQLGLLQMTQGRPADARVTWAALDQLPADNALRLFKQGLEALGDDRFAEARALIQQGIETNNFSPDLNRDMTNLIAKIPADGDKPAAATESPAMWLNAYRNSDQTH